MTKLAGEKAMALVDGQLAPDDVPELVQELARDPALVVELQKYLATGRSRIARPYESRLQEPVPQNLIDTVLRTPLAGPRPSSKPVDYLRSLIGRLKDRYSVPGWSLAAGPALAGTIVAVSAWLLMPASTVGADAEPHLAYALDTTPSGTQVPLGALKPILSFRSRTDALCRQYDVLYGAKQASHAVACRQISGDWRVVIATKSDAAGGLAPAGPESRRLIDEYVAANSAEDLDQSREREALGRRPDAR